MSELVVKILPYIVSKKLVSFYCILVIHFAIRFDYSISSLVIQQIKSLNLFSDVLLDFYNIVLSHFILSNYIVGIIFFLIYYTCYEFNLRNDKDYGYVFKKASEKFINSIFILINVCYAVNILRYSHLTVWDFYNKILASFFEFIFIPFLIVNAFVFVFAVVIELIKKKTKD